MITREPMMAGTFYPANPKELKGMLEGFLKAVNTDHPIPKAIIAPHAGYIYSGSIAAEAYACLAKARTSIKRVILLGPAHRYPVYGIAATKADYFATPLGKVKIDQVAISDILSLPQVEIIEQAYDRENALEVHLPFFQVLLQDFSLVPLLVGDASIIEIAEVIEKLWGGPETLVVVSSDLSHYEDYERAQYLDKQTANAILNLSPDEINFEQACGRMPIKGLLTVAAKKGLKATLIDLRNSGDMAGHNDRVVGYGAFHFR